MKKVIVVIIVFLLAIALLNLGNSKQEIRVRIVPNSNLKKDLEDKEEVKKIILVYLNTIYDNDYNKCKKNLENTIDDLNIVLNKYFPKICASLGYHTLYNKTYNDNAVKNEECYMLYVVIGNGDGDNWWGTIYPNLISMSSDEVIEYKSIFVDLFKKIKGESK
ncbi:MAG: stage II sporulation protein R [Anaeroplasma sp.]